jgi:hypothetical protein
VDDEEEALLIMRLLMVEEILAQYDLRLLLGEDDEELEHELLMALEPDVNEYSYFVTLLLADTT